MAGGPWFVAALVASSLVFFAVGRWLSGTAVSRGSSFVVANQVIQGVDCLLIAGATLAPNHASAEGFYLVGGMLFGSIPLLWLLFSLAYVSPEWLTTRVKLAVGGYYVLVSGAALTNPIHGLYATNIRFPAQPFPHVVAEPGVLAPLTYVAYALFLAGVLLLAFRLITVMRASRGQIGALVVGLLFPALYVPVVTLGTLPATIQGGYTSASFGYMLIGSTWPSALVAWAVLRYQLFDVVPLAREAVFEDWAEPVLVLDAERRVIDFNRAAVDAFPAVAEHAGAPLSDLAPDLVDPDGRFAESLTRFSGTQPDEYAVGVSTLSTAEGVRGYSLILRDVTDRERYVRDLEQQTAQLERFASTLSHDLRNPLNVAQARVRMAVESGDTTDLEKAEDALTRIETMIADLLTLAREGETIDETAPVSLPRVVRDAWETTQTEGATLVIDPRAEITVYADGDRLQTILENLLRNAIEHGGEAVTVTVGRLPDGFYVEDDGPGIPPEHRGDALAFGFSTEADGTGLGLAIVDAIATAHGWDVAVSEGSDGGARIAFTDVDVVEPAVDDGESGAAP